jgi:phosphatidylserine/phosphatidylglycerophosphate/cardiolipin synthase-like enzyme
MAKKVLQVTSLFFATLMSLLATASRPPVSQAIIQHKTKLQVMVSGQRTGTNQTVAIGGADVSVSSDEGDFEAQTDSQGVAILSDVPFGKYRVQVTAAGWKTYGQDWELNSKEKTITVQLKAAQETVPAPSPAPSPTPVVSPGGKDVHVAAAIKAKFGYREKELLSVGVMVHSKVVLVDPFGKHPALITGSHNLGVKASGKNDDNMVILEGPRARELAIAYAVNIISIFYTSRWRHYVATHARDPKAFHNLQDDDKWQDGHLKDEKGELEFWFGKPKQKAAAGPGS